MAESYRNWPVLGRSSPSRRYPRSVLRGITDGAMDGDGGGECGASASALPPRRPRTAAPPHMSERALERFERATLGPEHAAEHARERRALRHARAVWRQRTPSERRRILARAAAAQRASAATADGPSDQVGRWESRAHPVPHLRDQRGHAADRSRAVLGPVAAGPRRPRRASTTPRRTSGTRPRAPPASPRCARRRSTSTATGSRRRRPCSAPGSRCCRAARSSRRAGTSAYPVYASGGYTVSDFKGLNRAFTFDPWTLKWTEQPACARAAGIRPRRCSPTGGSRSSPAGTSRGRRPTTRTSRSSPRPRSAAGRGTMTRYANAERPGTSYYPHLFTMPDGRLLIGGAEPGRVGAARPGAAGGDTGASPWADLPDLSAQYRYSASAVLLPAGPDGSSRVGDPGRADAGRDGRARRDADVIDTRAAAPAWRRDDSVCRRSTGA